MIRKALVLLALVLFFCQGVSAVATDVNLTVQNCTGGTSIVNCSSAARNTGMNLFENKADVNNAKNASANFGMDNNSYNNTINSVKVQFRHAGNSGIDGSAGVTLQNNAGTVYCNQDQNVLNNTYPYQTGIITACTPTGGWTSAKLDDLNVLIINNDGGGSTTQTLDYLVVIVNYDAAQTTCPASGDWKVTTDVILTSVCNLSGNLDINAGNFTIASGGVLSIASGNKVLIRRASGKKLFITKGGKLYKRK